MPLVSAVCRWSVAAFPCAFVERKEQKAVANVFPIEDVAAVVALHQELAHRIGHPIRGPKVLVSVHGVKVRADRDRICRPD